MDMAFFNSLSTDLKVLAAAIVVFALLGLFAGSKKAEMRYFAVLALLVAGGVYRLTTAPAMEQQAQKSPSGWTEEPTPVTPARERKPIESTAAPK
jgi:outer membrane biosynthesis protein TonB